MKIKFMEFVYEIGNVLTNSTVDYFIEMDLNATQMKFEDTSAKSNSNYKVEKSKNKSDSPTVDQNKLHKARQAEVEAKKHINTLQKTSWDKRLLTLA